jgi:hypothetical protein
LILALVSQSCPAGSRADSGQDAHAGRGDLPAQPGEHYAERIADRAARRKEMSGSPVKPRAVTTECGDRGVTWTIAIPASGARDA